MEIKPTIVNVGTPGHVDHNKPPLLSDVTDLKITAIHHLKTFVDDFKRQAKHQLKIDVRINDHNFKLGDRIILKEYHPCEKRFTGKQSELTTIIRLAQINDLTLDELCMLDNMNLYYKARHPKAVIIWHG